VRIGSYFGINRRENAVGRQDDAVGKSVLLKKRVAYEHAFFESAFAGDG
jgi:hypothetical protein